MKPAEQDTLIRGTTVFIGTGFEKKESVDILIEGNIISRISPRIRVRAASVIDGRRFFITPGFINAHFHPAQQINRGITVGQNHDQLMDVLHATSKIKKRGDKLLMSSIAILEGLKSGTTCFYSVGSDIEDQIRTFRKLGVRAACVLISKDVEAEEKRSSVRARTWKTDERLREAERLHRRYHGELVRVHFGVVNVRYCSDRLILGMMALAELHDTYFHMHISESGEYVDVVLKRTGRTPVQHMAALGALNQRVSMAHAVHLTARDIGLIARAGAHVVHCPRANAFAAVGACPVAKLLKAGVNVALGSDAAICNTSNEVRGEAHAVFDRMQESLDRNELLNPQNLFRMLTLNGAAAMGLDRELGTIEEGKKADMVLWAKNDLPFIPGLNYIADLLFADSCRAHTVFIDGKVVLQNYELVTADEEKLKRRAEAAGRRYRHAMGQM